MKIATWNVNSIRARLEIVLNYLKDNPVDVLAVQEIKVEESKFPFEPFNELGYKIAVNGQKAYNGVAFISKIPFEDIKRDVIGMDSQKRTLESVISGVRILNAYFPHGGFRGDEKFFYKLEFYRKLLNYIKNNELLKEKFILLGDFNVAKDDIDVWDPELLSGTIGFMKEEREALEELISLGFYDPMREIHKNERVFTWWDYRAGSFRKGEGMRIDYILLSPLLKGSVYDIYVDVSPRKLKETSDHAPVILELNL